MSTRVFSGLAVLCLVTVMLGSTGLAAANEQRGSYVENKRWGFKIRAPKKWKSRMIPLDERWIAGKYFPDYRLRIKNAQNEIREMRPELWVIAFPHEREKNRKTVERPDENTVIITIRNPYKDYKDFVKRESWASTGAGGWHFAKEETTTQGDHEVDIYEIKVEKLVDVPLRVVTWVYHCDDVDFAVQLRIPEDHYKANRSVIEGVMKSFREIPRTEPFPEDEKPTTVTSGENKRKTIEEVDAERAAAVRARIDREVKNLPKDWRVKRSKHYVVIAPKDKRYNMPVTYVLNFAEEIRKYLEKSFSDLGPSAVPPGLIRIFPSTADEQAYMQGTRGWWADEVREITMTYSGETSLLSEFSWIAGRITDQYFHIKNENLTGSMPGWIRTGIWGHVQWARPSKRKKMVLAPTPHDIREVRTMLAQGTQASLRDLMTISGEDVQPEHHAQARSVVYWLLGRGNKGKVKGAVTTYLKALEDIIKDEDKKFEEAEKVRREEQMKELAENGDPDAGKSDEELEKEEDERFRNRRQSRESFNSGMTSRFEAIRTRAQEAAFGHLTDKDWAALDKKWKKFAER